MKLLCVVVILCTCITEARSLICNQCFGAVCNPSPTNCLSSVTRCQTASIRRSIGFFTISQITQGCEQNSQAFSFSSGEIFFSRDNKFCRTDLCNTQTTADPTNMTLNGLECFGCVGTDAQSCISRQQSVKCVGQQNRCINATGTQNILRTEEAFFTKGCATESICNHSINLEEFLIRLNSMPLCCTGNLCNNVENATVTSTVGMTSTQGQTVPTTAMSTNASSIATVAPTTTPTTTTTTTPGSGESNDSSSNSGGTSD
ncbi:urokinase plasminogen activator surface receptor-like [Carcharodon carcharias]|uniref:urokinase plasminogen activator surface receptor-like n=1 Tax=Carcharodon carcharias TaxID=13397 RepID=UPI001B7E9B9D|nr:urokinase plasminogen activator surface receptor-like [Carcharodon carcharias]